MSNFKKKKSIFGINAEPAPTVVGRYCDEPMARNKGFLPCDMNCKGCHACIEILHGGDRRHFVPKNTK